MDISFWDKATSIYQADIYCLDRWLVTSWRFFFVIYLRSTSFWSRLFALTTQLRPSLYLPVAATTSGGWLQPFAVPAASTPCERPASPPLQTTPIFLFSLLAIGRFLYRTRDRNSVALPMPATVLHEYICTQQIRVYSIHPFRCKVSYRLPWFERSRTVSSWY